MSTQPPASGWFDEDGRFHQAEQKPGPRRKLGCWVIIGLVVVGVLISGLARGCAANTTTTTNCGDYDYEDGTYVSAPNSGDYDLAADGSYEYVGCETTSSNNRSGGGGIFFLPFIFGGSSGSSGGTYGDGSNYRGGGPGSGK